jgi:hypothetical protein
LKKVVRYPIEKEMERIFRARLPLSRKIYYATIVLSELCGMAGLSFYSVLWIQIIFLVLIASQFFLLSLSRPPDLKIDDEKLAFMKKPFYRVKTALWKEIHLFEIKEKYFFEPIVWMFFVPIDLSVLIIALNRIFLLAGWIVLNLAVLVLIFRFRKKWRIIDLLLSDGSDFKIKGYYYPEHDTIYGIIVEKTGKDAETFGAEDLDYDSFPPLG